jgi:hypothetical protein
MKVISVGLGRSNSSVEASAPDGRYIIGRVRHPGTGAAVGGDRGHSVVGALIGENQATLKRTVSLVTMNRAVVICLTSQPIQAHNIVEALGHALVGRAAAAVVGISLMV